MRHWFYLTESRRRIAIPEADFYPLAEAGVISPETMVWTEGMSDWISAGEIHPELFGDATAMAPVDLPTVLQMTRTLSAPLARASGAIKIGAVLLVLSALAMTAAVILAAIVAADQVGSKGWFALFALPLAALPLLLAFPMMRLANTVPKSHFRLDRGAFYATSRTLGRTAWIGAILAALLFVTVAAASTLAVVYRSEIVEFMRAGISATDSKADPAEGPTSSPE